MGNQAGSQLLVWIITAQAHAGVDVDLGKPSGRELPDELFCFLHRLFGREMAEGQRAQVIPAENDISLRKAYSGGYSVNIVPEILGSHAAVAAVLVHLVGCGFDQYVGLIFLGPFQAGLDHQFVGGTR